MNKFVRKMINAFRIISGTMEAVEKEPVNEVSSEEAPWEPPAEPTCELIDKHGSWRQIADAARTTIHKEAGEKEPSSKWKRRMLLCEHSPIRLMTLIVKLRDLRSWVSVHLTRHSTFINHFVRTQRTDRTGLDRNFIPQGAAVEHQMTINPQSFIDTSRKRLCKQASPETTTAWKKVLDSIKETEPELFAVCVPDCIYRGHCYEYGSCGYHKTAEFKQALAEYRDGINGAVVEKPISPKQKRLLRLLAEAKHSEVTIRIPNGNTRVIVIDEIDDVRLALEGVAVGHDDSAVNIVRRGLYDSMNEIRGVEKVDTNIGHAMVNGKYAKAVPVSTVFDASQKFPQANTSNAEECQKEQDIANEILKEPNTEMMDKPSE